MNHVTLDPTCWNSLGNKNFLDSVFHGNKRVTSLNDSEKCVCWVSCYSYTIPMGRKTYRLKTKFSATEDVLTNWYLTPEFIVNTIYPLNCFFPLFFPLGKIRSSSFCYLLVSFFGHQLSTLAAKYTCALKHETCDYEVPCGIGSHTYPHLLI